MDLDLHDARPAAPSADGSDPDVIASVLAGDPSRFAILVRRHNQAVFRACRAVLRDDADAEDAVQAAWVNGYRALASFRRDARFRTWITRIAVNEASARLRRRRRTAAVPLDDADLVDRGADPAREVFDQELRAMLERLIDALPETLRQVLVLRDIVELDTGETARCLGLGEEAVRVRLHRARQRLALALTRRIGSAFERATPDVWRFDGERCARMEARVMAAITS